MRMEHWWFELPLRLRSLFRRGRVDRELDEELQFHLDHKIEEGIAGGLSQDEARYAAMRAMDGLEQRKEEMRDMRRVQWVTDFFDDARYAVRTLRRVSRLTVFVVITLALGIGMTAASFSMLDALIFRPYPVPHSSDVVTLVSTSRDNSLDYFSYREYLDIRDHTKSYDGVIANAVLSGVGFSADPRATPRVKAGLMVSGNYFRALGVEPTLGRGFRDAEDSVPDRDPVVVISWDFWKHEFAGNPSILGRTVRLNGTDFTVIGVAPESFPGMLIFSRPDFYVPMAMARVLSTNREKNFFEDRDDRELTVRARLKSGTTLEQARNELAMLARNFQREYPILNRNRGAGVHTQLEMRTRPDQLEWKFGVIFVILALGVLLVACTNVAGLLLSRARTRTREIAVRLALGAGRFRLVRLLLAESLILACLGGLGGIAVGYGVIAFFGTFRIPTELPVTIPFRMDTRVLMASLGMSLVSAFLCGLAPALQSTRTDLVSGLKSADVDLPGRRRLWGRNALVVAQVSLSLMLLTASFLMARSFEHSVLGTTGFAKDHLLMARFDPRLVQYNTTQTKQFYERLTERLRAAPGVLNVALTEDPPLGLEIYDRIAFAPGGYDMPRDRETFTSSMDTVDEGYFDTMQIPIVRGRAFQTTDRDSAPRVAIVNQHFAKRYWPDTEAVGKRIRLDGRTGPVVEIVGVAQTIKYRETGEKPIDFVYLPFAQHPIPRMVLMLRSSGDPLELVKPVKDVVRTLDPNLPISEMRTYEELVRYSTVEGPRIAIELVGTMGVVALLLAVAGLYGLVAYNVSRRTHEIGIRMAIGAGPSDVLRLVMGKGLALVGIGTVLGLAMGFAVEQAINSMLFNAEGVDLLTYVIVVPSMFLVTMLAAYVPARRASRIAPLEALRYE
jgi:macrolide transport system ATP-binding/permease protein